MSYLVLARKYRPRSFDAMVGQQHVVQALANALTQQRLHHAYLFTGTRGVGKTTVSRILAKSLNCTGADGQGSITAQPCGVCDACRDIDAGRFVDYVELDAASNRGVEEITQLLDQAVYKPVLGRFKVYMVDEVHMLTNHAFNAMLKTLEEPPSYLKFVLATTDPQKVPATVLSRCLQFNLRPMAAATIQEHLGTVLGAESIEAEAGALRLLARAARGSMRDALSLADQAIAFDAGALTEDGIRHMLGAVDRSHAVHLLDALSSTDGAALLAVVDALRGLGLSASGTLEELAELLQQMAIVQAVGASADDTQSADVARLAGCFAADHTALLYSMCLHGRAELGLAPDEYGGLVMVLLRMLAFRPQAHSTSAVEPTTAATASARASIALQAPRVAKAAVPVAAPFVRASQHRSVVRRAGPVESPEQSEAVIEPGRVEPRRAVADDPVPAWVDAPEAQAEELPADPAAALAVRASGTPNQLADPIGSQTPEPDAAPSRRVVASAALASASSRLVPTELGARWAATVEGLIERGSISALARELAWQAQCISIVETALGTDRPAMWRLRVERETLLAPAHCERLQLALADWLQNSVRLETEVGRTDDTPALRALAERERRQREAEQIIEHDPLVRSLLSQYQTARIVPGSIQPG